MLVVSTSTREHRSGVFDDVGHSDPVGPWRGPEDPNARLEGGHVNQDQAAPSLPDHDAEHRLSAVELATVRVGEIDAALISRRRRLGVLARLLGNREPGALADPALEALRRLVVDLILDHRNADALVTRAIAAGVRPAVAASTCAHCRAIAHLGTDGRQS
jgi:hypothetical protein